MQRENFKLVTRLPGGVTDEQLFEHRIEAENAAEEYARSGFFSTVWGLKQNEIFSAITKWEYICEFSPRRGGVQP